MRSTTFAAWALAMVTTGVPAAAQQTGVAEYPERVASGWVFTPSVAVGVLFDDNPTLASHGNPSPSDVIGTVRPGGNLSFTQKHTQLGLGYHGALIRYRDLTRYDNYEQRATVDFRHQPMRRLQLFARESYMDTPATDAIQVAGVPFYRTGSRHNELDAGASVLATRGLEVRGDYRFQWLEFDRPDSATAAAFLQGGQSHGVGFDARQQVSARWRVGASYDFRHALLGQPTSVRARDTFDTQNAEALVEWQASPTLVIEGGGGISYLALPGPAGSRTGPAGHISLRKRTEYAYLTLNAMRSFVPSFSFGGSFRNQEVSASARVPFAARRAYVQGAVAWRDSQPVLANQLGLRALWVDATVGYVLQRWLRVEGYYGGAFQDTTVAGGQIDRNRVGVQIVTSRPVRFQ